MTKILVFDIETAPTTAAVYNFWQMGNVAWVFKHWYILSFAWKWLDEKKISVLSLPDFPNYNKDKSNDKLLVKELWSLFNSADIIIAHNGKAFDTKKTNARFVFHGFPPPSPYKEIDTKIVAKTYFKFDSNSLDNLGDFLGVGRKRPTGGFKMWQGCIDGLMKDWRKMCLYNKGDVKLLENVYYKLRPFMRQHPNVALINGEVSGCPNCGSKSVQRRGFSYTRVSKFQKLQCNDCHSWHQRPLNRPNTEVKQIR